MAEGSGGYELARRRLGKALRRYRETANIRIEAAAGELECSAAKISRLENGLGPAKLWEVRVLLDLYEVRDRTARTRLEQWAKDSKEPGWWEEVAADVVSSLHSDDPNLYLAAETEASRIRLYCTPVLPALLQTADYAAAHTRARQPEWSASQIERFVELQQKRQERVLREADPLRIDAILDEGAVRRVVGGRETHLAQLRWLVDLLDTFAAANRDTLVVRIWPFSAGVPHRVLNPFTIFDPRHPDLDAPMVYLEDTSHGYWSSTDESNALINIFTQLTRSTLDPEQSRRLLREVVDEGLL
jgi:hypothetical protein